MPDAFAGDAERLARFEREAQLLAVLNHPHIAAIYGVAQEGPVRALVLELVEGPTLADRIAEGALPLDEALPLARQMAEALEAAHEQGIIHRDLKPANIKLRPDGTVKVLDFGLAKALDQASAAPDAATQSPTITSPLLTQRGVILDTAAYMSPEQARGREADRRSDIWAFGCVLYELLTGARAFPGDEITDTLAAIVRAEPDWAKLPTDTPAAIRRVLKRCLEKNLKERLPHIGAARLEIVEGIAHPREDAVTAPSPGLAAMVRHRSTARLAWSVAVLALASTAGLGVAWFRTADPVGATVRFTLAEPAGARFARSPINFMEVSPDGSHIAFIAGESQGNRVYLRPLNSAEATPVPGTEGSTALFWSGDSRRLAVYASGQLKAIDAADRSIRTLCNLEDVVISVTWNREGTIVYATLRGTGLFRLADGCAVTPLTALEFSLRETRHMAPQFLPDGRRYLFVVLSDDPEVSGTYVGSLDSAGRTRILSTAAMARPAGAHYRLFLQDGALFAQWFDARTLAFEGEPRRVADDVAVPAQFLAAFSVSHTGVVVFEQATDRGEAGFELVWSDRTRKVLSTLPARDYRGLNLSPDGTRAVVHAHDEDAGGGDVFIVDLSRKTETRVTFDPSQHNQSPIWSPDGTSIAFSSVRNGRYGLYRKASNNVGPDERLFESETPKIPASWSPDGSSMVFVEYTPNTAGDLWRLPLTGDRAPVLVAGGPGTQVHPQISPDGLWLAFSGYRLGSPRNIWVQGYVRSDALWEVARGTDAADPAAALNRPATAVGSVIQAQPRWRSDGRELFWVSQNPGIGGSLWSVAVEPSDTGLSFGSSAKLFDISLWNLSHGQTNFNNYAVSADGQRIRIFAASR